MANIFVEQQASGKWKALRNHQTVATANTQAGAARRAHNEHPDDRVLGERVRNTNRGSRDKWRHLY